MAYRTFNEWVARGRAVQKGEKAMGFLNDGTAIFGKEQTTKTPKGSPNVGCSPKGSEYGYDSWDMGDDY